MSMDDRDLRDHFERMQREEAARAPAFAHTLARANAASRTGRATPRWLWGACAAAAALLLWLALPPSPAPPSPALPAWQPDRWAMPTDVLLEVPGAELLHDLPEITIPYAPATSLRHEFPRRTTA